MGFEKGLKLTLIFSFVLLTYSLHAQTIKGSKRVANDSVYIDFINPFLAPLEVEITPKDSVASFIRVSNFGVLHHKDTLKKAISIPLVRIKDTANIKTTDYIIFKANFGISNEDYDKDYAYSLPFPKGKRYKIIQSFGGKFSHNKPHSRYAIDIGTQIGDTITAIRPGIVFFIKEDSKDYCRTSKCVDKGNKVLILHDDGTMAHYVHLDFEGALINVGDRVEEGEPIAISGMTGFTTTPHLHLVLYKSRGISIPFKFKYQKGKKLKQDKFYKRNY
jgi:murein DD-endopeptidase MepM/ murein hydrolase activator NlpD